MSFYISNVYSVQRNEFNKTSQHVLIILSNIYCAVFFSFTYNAIPRYIHSLFQYIIWMNSCYSELGI